MAARTTCLITSIKAEAAPSNGVPRNQNPLPRLSFSRPSWVVRTESNVRKEEKKKPYPPCVVCRGSGRVKCCHCQGRDLGLAVGMVLVVASVAWGPEFRNIMRLHSMKKWKLREPSGRRPTVKYLLLGSTPASKCKTCGGSGLGYCSRCLGTGEHRGIMGFRFMKMDAQGTQQGKENPQ